MRMRATIAGLAAAGSAAAATAAIADQAPWVPPQARQPMPAHAVKLRAMPEGTARYFEGMDGNAHVRFSVTGLTPGSKHSVDSRPGTCLSHSSSGTLTLGVLRANAEGRAERTFNAGQVGSMLPRRVLTIREGTQGKVMDGGVNPLAAEGLACASVPRRLDHGPQLRVLDPLPEPSSMTDLPAQHTYGDWGTYAVAGMRPSLQAPQGGVVRYSYLGGNTVRISINGFGFSPGPHAAHIHQGSCGMQGGVVGMIGDLLARPDGVIGSNSAVVHLMASGPQQPLDLSHLYVNIHQGNGNQILSADGTPTLQFRPLACANLNLASQPGVSGMGSQTTSAPTQTTSAMYGHHF
jgi:hypothetical protein